VPPYRKRVHLIKDNTAENTITKHIITPGKQPGLLLIRFHLPIIVIFPGQLKEHMDLVSKPYVWSETCNKGGQRFRCGGSG